MILTEGLVELYTLQQRLDEEAHHSLQEYVVKSHQHIEKMIGNYGLTLTYGTITGGDEPIFQDSPPLCVPKKKRSRTFHKKHVKSSQTQV